MSEHDIPMDVADQYAVYPDYPDIDETIQYPWADATQQSDQLEGDVPHALIDPRLYGGEIAPASELPGEVAQTQTQGQQYYPASEFSDDSQRLDNVDQGDDDSEFVNDSESDEEEEGEEDPDDSDSDGRRRRKRRGRGRFSGRYGARGAKGVRRGPRKPLEPGPEFTMLNSAATEAFLDQDYEKAMDLVQQAIQINPEMFIAHSLLSELFLAQGQKDKALAALFNGAHTRPKDPSVWLKVARAIFQRAGDDRQSALRDVLYCYSRVCDIEPRNFNIRYQRAAVYRELGYTGKAAAEYERILRERPHNARALRHLAEIYIDLQEVPKAIELWTNSVEHYLSTEPENAKFSWSEVNIYVELFSLSGRPDEGLHALKSLARWLLGRRNDPFWENFEDDDREWDSNDSPRRIKTDGFVPGQWPADSYGLGLPLELRIKMGLFRLKMGERCHDEALHHFEWLNPEDTSEFARIFDYGDLFREVADSLKNHGLLEEALRFYWPIQETADHADVSYFMALADCCVQLERYEDAETFYLTITEHDSQHMESRFRLAKLYESLSMKDEASKYINEAILIGRQQAGSRRRKDTRLEQLAEDFRRKEHPGYSGIAGSKPTATFTTATHDHDASILAPGEDTQRAADAQFLYRRMRQLEPQVKAGNKQALEDWLDIADGLLRDFRSNRVFYPMARTMEFQGYHKKTDKNKEPTLLDEAQDMAARLQKGADKGESRVQEPSDAIPDKYYGISFDEWLDIFLQYALHTAEQGEPNEAYDALDSASVANIWIHSKRKLRMIHVCWFTCALRAHDEDILAQEARWFIKEYQFVTDTYRLFSMLNYLAGDPRRPLFHASPSMKFMLRQIKAMDFTIPDDPARPALIRETIWRERAALSTKDEFGEPIPATSLDIALLILYGHILFSGGSFYPALNYFFRAYALDDQNPMCLLSIALCFVHHALKRQSENRHYLIMQGLAMMNEYRRVRTKPGAILAEKQEMEFNFARVYHGLGLVHQAIDGYEKVLKIGQKIRQQAEDSSPDDPDVVMTDSDQPVRPAPPASGKFVEDFSQEAAYSLQCLHMMGGNEQAAKNVTNEWLVI